ncbi:hypothetical protein BDZ97DRAFT_1925063 [Flammula alnicola]|nr:hypothetical protein BDZ97DRAFT_1925063 [Flammula alnicola]
MAPAPPFTSTNGANNALFPALYLYPLNDTWAPKHIALTSQHTKIGRQTSSKTAPGERNGFFDSKVLSRQHAEVWEEGGKIFIKDVKSSNGTFINGERLSSEGHESEPFELKSDDIVEFGIDIVGEDNKTIIHHKVAARVVCVFSEQDAQVAARAEQHQQQQQLQQHQFLQQQQQQQQAGASTIGPAGPSGINGVGGGPGGMAPQNFPFAAQRRAQIAQQGLGGMGGVRPPGKTGLSFDVILSRLQGEVQKSRETGAELNSLTGAMGEIHDTLGGAVPANLPPFPTHLPPVRPPQEAHPQAGGSNSPSPEQPSVNPSSSVSAAAVVDLQSQLRDTQSSLASHLDKVRALEGALAEQETIKREVSSLREMMEERRREMEAQAAAHAEQLRHELEAQLHPPHHHERHEHEHEEDDASDREISDDDDDDDDARSVSTVLPHELERVDEEDEEQLAEEERRELARDEEERHLEGDRELRDEEDMERIDESTLLRDLGKTEAEVEAEAEAEEQERRRAEDLGVGRPRTPEPTRMGLRDADSYPARASLLGSGPRRSSMTSPLSHVSSSELRGTDDVYEQVQKLSKQVSTVMALTSTLEAQHSTAQMTISTLESKVASLEAMLKAAEEALAQTQAQAQAQRPPRQPSASTSTEPEQVAVDAAASAVKQEKESLVEMMAEWKKSVEGQWGTVQEEWTQERERLGKAREEWEAKSRQVDTGLEKMATLQTTLASQQQQIQVQLQQHIQQHSALIHGLGNGDAIKPNGGLVTPPSPRSQSSDSGRYRRRRRRSGAGSRARAASRGSSGSREEGEGDDVDTDATLASSTEDDVSKHGIARALGFVAATAAASVGGVHQAQVAARTLATPEPSVYKLSASVDSLDISTAGSPQGKGLITAPATRANSQDVASLLVSLLGLIWALSLMLFSAILSLLGNQDSIAGDASSSSSSAGGSKQIGPPRPTINVQTAIGVVLLSVAAAAVIWKVKPE